MSLLRESKVAIITGTSSNLGLNIGHRLLAQLPASQNLTVIVTSRTLPRAIESIAALKLYAEKNFPYRTGSLDFDYLLLDFTNMVLVLSAAHELNRGYKHIDYVFFNASQTAFCGIDWLGACKEVFASPIQAATNPTYKLQAIGLKSKDGMGLVFQGNVFGPFYFISKIKLLLCNGGRIVWISSIMSGSEHFSFNDYQLLQSPASYEGSKRLIDLLHVATYKLLAQDDIVQYVVQPGIFTSFGFFQYLNVFTFYGMLALFYIARWCGLPYHVISGYKAANAPVHCALENDRQDCKIGSASDRAGHELLTRTEIDVTGAEDVGAYLQNLAKEWDEKLKDQITPTRQL